LEVALFFLLNLYYSMKDEDILCNDCQISFKSRNKLFKHIRSVHNRHVGAQARIQVTQAEILRSLGSQSAPTDDVTGTVDTIYEDEAMKVVVKPQGLATMGESPCLWRHDHLLLPGALYDPTITYKKAIPCHRLDKETGGLVVCSKSAVAETTIRSFFRHKLVQKRYRAILIGKLDSSTAYGQVSNPVQGKYAESLLHIVSYTASPIYDCLTTVDLWPITGRKHQLRKHMQALGHPILGDKIYLYSTEWPTSTDEMCLWSLALDLPRCSAAVSSSMTSSSSEVRSSSKAAASYGDDSEMDEENGDMECQEDEVARKKSVRSHPKGQPIAMTELTQEDFHRRLHRGLATHSDELVHVEIAEPLYFEAIRRAHQRIFDELADNSNSSSR
jgi:23S rRNA-/tRNA-specific pseudouridylate synthase